MNSHLEFHPVGRAKNAGKICENSLKYEVLFLTLYRRHKNLIFLAYLAVTFLAHPIEQ
jgi:hypothetical protein